MISVADWECPYSGHDTDEVLGQVFHVQSNHTRRSVKRIIGEEIIIFPQASRLIFPSQLLSIFLWNALDLLQSLELLEIIVERLVCDVYLPANKLISTIEKYDMWEGESEIGGLFPRYLLQNGHAYVSLYDSIKNTLEM